MSQIDSGVRRVLALPWLYSVFQNAVGARRLRRWVLTELWQVRPGMRLVDIGCGPGDILSELPEVDYVGVDISEAYIARAARTHGPRGTFVAGTSTTLRNVSAAQQSDLVACIGVLHHLDDTELHQLLEDAYALLKPNGRFVALEPTYLRHQSATAKWIMSQDRGQSIRTEAGWRSALALSSFKSYETTVVTGLLRLPYTHIVLEAHVTRPGASHSSTDSTCTPHPQR